MLALQEPFSALAARRLKGIDFVGFTQIALLASIPLLVASGAARRDFVLLLKNISNWPKFLALLGVGVAGLSLYDVGLSSAHPIITAAVLNLSPFWAALVARVVSGRTFPGRPATFVGCFLVAFVGAMIVAFSQIAADSATLVRDIIHSLLHSRWVYALPMPIFFALSGALVYKWFRFYDEGAAIACNFLVSAAVLIPATLFVDHFGLVSQVAEADKSAIFLLLTGTLASAAGGRLFYQSALNATENDNGFVTMFFLAIPAISALVSWPLSMWFVELRFNATPLFFGGLALVTAPLLVFAYAHLGVGRLTNEPVRATTLRQ